ncbi:MAG TPA: DUF1850 domain-containing protein [Casimicrobiaceae bacterium]|nr:DUF1850 domain-containing protein [Casimicrobiaceae bacterium]
MSAVCLIVAGVVSATLPTEQFTLSWIHSVEKTRWEETYRIDGDRLALIEARIQGMGAGMEPPVGARFSDGWWIWRPNVPPLPALDLSRSPYTRDYDICFALRCAELGALTGAIDATGSGIVTAKPCPGGG